MATYLGGNIVRQLLTDRNIDISGLMNTSKSTVTKTRVIGGHQQIVRFDFEEVTPIDETELAGIVNWFNEILLKGPDAVIISDYGKGVCTQELCQFVIEKCNQKKIPVIVDPKGTKWEKYYGSDFVTPNIREFDKVISLVSFVDDDEIYTKGQLVRKKFNFGNLLVTRSERGMSLINDHIGIHVPTQSQEVFDVSGAGDTVISTLTAFIAGRMDSSIAVKIANLAASIVVGKLGTYPVSRDDLIEAMERLYSDSAKRKVLKFDDAVKKVEKWKKDGEKIVFTNGCFDLIHPGHLSCLEQAKMLGDKLIVGLNSDTSVRALKGIQRPIMKESDRANLLSALESVSLVVIFDESTPYELIREIKPHILVKGGDYSIETVIGNEFAKEVVIIPNIKDFSSSKIIEKVIEEKLKGLII